MTTKSLENYHLWLKENALWNDSLVSTKLSPIGGVGVFWKNPSELKDADDSLIDTVLLRVPKSNILSTKNSSIYNLLVDYAEIQEQQEDDMEIDLTSGMHGLIICFTYELAMKEASPWYHYLVSIDPACTEIDLPICLWSESERKLLQNTECAILGMDDLEELIVLYEACVQFAKFNEKLVDIPDVFDIDLSKKDEVFDVYKQKLTTFGTYVQSVISRAFQVDEYHGPSLVPGADLFNHLSPLVTEEGEVIERENVHFLCDGGDDVCYICGEQDCDHMFEDMEEGEDEGEEGEDDDDNEQEDDEQEDDEDEEDDINVSEIEFSDADVQLSDSSSESEDEHDHHDHNHDEESENDSSETDIGEITMELIERLEREIGSDDEDQDDTANDTTGLDNSIAINDTIDGLEHSISEDLQTQLANSSQCVDIVLTSLPEEQYDFEVFNTYGNELSNPYLLQRYGFVCSSDEPNLNDSVSLHNQLHKYITRLQKNATTNKEMQLQVKLTWLEENFELLCEIIHDFKKQQIMDAINAERDQKEENDDENEDDNDDEDIEDDLDDDDDFPETWEASAKVAFDGSVSYHTYAIMRLIHIPFKIFRFKLWECKPSRLDSRIFRYLLNELTNDKEKLVNKDIRTMVEQKLAAYPKDIAATTTRSKIIKNLVDQEKAILQRYIDN